LLTTSLRDITILLLRLLPQLCAVCSRFPSASLRVRDGNLYCWRFAFSDGIRQVYFLARSVSLEGRGLKINFFQRRSELCPFFRTCPSCFGAATPAAKPPPDVSRPKYGAAKLTNSFKRNSPRVVRQIARSSWTVICDRTAPTAPG